LSAPVSDEGLNDTAICKKGPLSPVSYLYKLKYYFFLKCSSKSAHHCKRYVSIRRS